MKKIAAITLITIMSCKNEDVVDKKENLPPKELVTQPVELPKKPSTKELLFTKSTTKDALMLVSPLMDDEFGVISDGTRLLTLWSINNLVWKDVYVINNETSYAKVKKDPDAERLKRICVNGTIIQIETVKPEEGTIYAGIIYDNAHDLYHFGAVKSSGELVSRSTAKICGFVTGVYNYENSKGGTGHAVDMVGIFDLPENHK